ncbi:MMPL family transporter [Streptomyces sp. ISL-12]|uniref:MMPL family transporter n=1 Tax=Streptomyces sp. ISL-12 TaxID=2819177 RepID=UPI001BE83EBD|nr:MMPL family transporter [Streptomyces sp. ISL-12]MBT2409501.1 MMPL family transporter [Streptomyces sp. ISL-12]
MGGVEHSGGKRRKALPWAVLGLWVVLLAFVAPFATELGDVQVNRAVDYLPAGADSTRVARVQDAMPGGEATSVVVVYHRDGALTEADKATAAEQIARVDGQFELTGTPRAVTSEDGSTVMYPVSTTTPGQDDEERDAFVAGVREVTRGGDGLDVQVGGPDALSSDARGLYGSVGGPVLYTTVAVVAVLLILIYRSPFLWLVPLAVAGIADFLSMGAAYGLNRLFDTTVSSQSSSVMTILVFGAGTDYALLIVARYREELRRVTHPYDAMRATLRGCGPAVLASSGTVAVGLLCLLFADLGSSRGMGPLGALGVLCALAAMMTLLPAVLVLLGRRVFWPAVPAHGSHPTSRRSLFAAMGTSAGRRPLTVLASGAVLLGALALGAFSLPGSLKQEDSYTETPESIVATRTLAGAFPDRGTEPLVIAAATGRADEVIRTVEATSGVQSAERGRSGGGWTEISVITDSVPQTPGETATIEALRSALDGRAYVGGLSAEQLDLRETNGRDRVVVVPIVLAAVLLILIALLRSLVAPLILLTAVVAVWGASLGIAGLVFAPLFGFEGTDPGLALLSFVFLVALGVDYGIFLMHRMREECLNGDEPGTAALTALRTTGGVIASAGLVLAGTFAVLTAMPVVTLVELGFVIAVGVLLDTFLVRTYLVTSAGVALGRKVWWPGPLSRKPAPAPAERERRLAPTP